LARELGCSRIIDVGCGRAQKLIKLHPEFSIVGIDHGPNIEYCRRYTFGTWIECDVERESLADLPAQGSVVVCADVIEHLVNPVLLLQSLRTLLERGAGAVLLSTPERDLLRGRDHFGPPPNPCHVREWNTAELRKLLLSMGFEPHMQLTARNDLTFEEKTILAISTKLSVPPAPCEEPANKR
jgi:SAM-dependent methyltransferase